MKVISFIKKALIVCIITGLLPIIFAGCADNNESIAKKSSPAQRQTNRTYLQDSDVEKVEVNYWNVFTGPDGKFMKNIVEEFNKENQQDITVKMRVMASDEYYSKLIPSVASGTAPDVGIMHISRMPQFAATGIITPLDALANSLNLSDKDFISSLWDAGTFNGKHYTIPLDVHPQGLYYNTQLLLDAGFSKPPRTRQEFLEMAKACTKDTDGDGVTDQWGCALNPRETSQPLFWSLLYQFGGKAMSDDGKAPAYNSPKGVQALQFMWDLVYKYKVSPQNLYPDGELTLFKQGKLAFYINGIWMISELRDQKDLNFETAPLPQFGSQKAVWADSHNLVMFKQRKEDQKKTAASSKFISFLSEHSLEWAKAGQIPARNVVRESPEFRALKDQDGFAQQVGYVVFPIPTANFDAIWSPTQEQIANVVLGKIKTEDALKAASDEAKKRIQDNK